MSAVTPPPSPPPVEYGYTVVFEPLPEGGYGVSVPAVPEIVTFGATLDEARVMAKDAIRCFLESSLAAGEAVPDDVAAAVTTERIAVKL